MSRAERVESARRTARRAAAVARIRVAARLAHADVRVSIHPTADVGRVQVVVAPGARASLTIGAHSSLGDGVEIRLLDGGEVSVGDWVEIRGGVRMMVGGLLTLTGSNLLSWGVVIHCDEAVTLHGQATVGEYSTISDSAHEHRPGSWHLDNITTAPVTIGSDTWLAPKATVTRGVRVGDRCIVAAGAVVTKDVPDDHVALGVPAVSRPR